MSWYTSVLSEAQYTCCVAVRVFGGLYCNRWWFIRSFTRNSTFIWLFVGNWKVFFSSLIWLCLFFMSALFRILPRKYWLRSLSTAEFGPAHLFGTTSLLKENSKEKTTTRQKKNIFATDLFWIQINFDHRKADDTPKSNQINRINSKRKQSHRKRSFIHIFVFCRHSPKLAKMLTNKLPEEVDTLLSKGQIPIIDLAHCGEYFLD